MPETTDTPPPASEGPKIASVMDKLRTLSAKPAELKQAALERLGRLRTSSQTAPRGVLEELADGEAVTEGNFTEIDLTTDTDIDPTLEQDEGSETPLDSPDNSLEDAEAENKELAKIAELRKKLGLPEKSPFLIDNIAEVKEKYAQGFVQTEIEKKFAEKGGFVDRAEKEWKEKVSSMTTKDRELNFKENGFSRLAQARGLTDAQAKFTSLKGVDTSLGLVDMTNSDVIAGLNHVDTRTLTTAVNRLRAIGFNITLDDFSNPDTVAAINSVGSCPDATYAEITRNLNQLYAVDSLDYALTRDGHASDDLRGLAEASQAGGLSPQQLERIEWANKFAASSSLDSFVITDKGIATYRYYHREGGIRTILNNGVTGEQAKSLWALSSNSLYFSHLDEPDARPIANVDTNAISELAANGSLEAVAKLARESWVDMRSYYQWSNSSRPQRLNDEYGEQRFRQTERATHDPIARELVALVSELKGKGNRKPIDRAVDNTDAIYEKRHTITDVLQICHALPTSIRPDPGTLLDIAGHHGNDIIINNPLLAALKQDHNRFHFSTNEDLFINACKNMLVKRGGLFGDTINEGLLPVVSLLAQHADRISDYVKNVPIVNWGFNPCFIEDIILGKIASDPQVSEAAVNFYFESHGSTPSFDASAMLLNGAVAQSSAMHDRFLNLLVQSIQNRELEFSATTSGGQELQEFQRFNYGHSRAANLKLLNDFPNWRTYFSDTASPDLIIDTFFKAANIESKFYKYATFTLEAKPDMTEAEIASFWRLARDLPTELARNLLIEEFEDLPTLFPDGHPSHEALYLLAKVDGNGYTVRATMDRLGTNALTEIQQSRWKAWTKQAPKVQAMLHRHWDIDFDTLVVDGQLTPDFWRLFVQEEPDDFLRIANKDTWRSAFGKEIVDKLLDVLPKATDEKRNAFMHNAYDRTSAFFRFLNGPHSAKIFELTNQDVRVATDYIKRFGLDQNPYLFYLFKPLFLVQTGELKTLPNDFEELGISTIAELEVQIAELRNLLFESKEIVSTLEMTGFQKNILASITGKATHSFPGRPSMEVILREFEEDKTSGEITPVPEEYSEFTLETDQGILSFDPEPYRPIFTTVAAEITAALDHPDETVDLTDRLSTMYRARLEDANQALEKIPEAKREFIQKKIDEYNLHIAQLASMRSLDEVLRFVIKAPVDKTEKNEIGAIKRQIVWRRLFERHNTASFIEGLRNSTSGEISPAAILSIVNLQRELVKHHVLNLDKNNAEQYWDAETFAMLTGEVRGRQLIEDAFDPALKPLFSAVSTFELDVSTSQTVKAIPDRGLVGEMAGYLANACYTAEYPLLKRHPNVTPFKFIVENAGGDKQFFGSTLVFEVKTADGQKALLVRAFNVPGEEQYNMDGFIEGFLDQIAITAGKRGASRVLFAGASGTISNYRMTSAYVISQYVNDKDAVPLSEQFAFNSYDITNNCYEARKIAPVKEAIN